MVGQRNEPERKSSSEGLSQEGGKGASRRTSRKRKGAGARKAL